MKKSVIYIVWLYAIMAFLFFGGMLSTIITQYPNWDYDLPNSLIVTNSFYSKASPGTFFQLMGKITIPIFIIMIISIWKLKKARNMFLAHFIAFLIIALGTVLIIYPVLFELGADSIASRSIEDIESLLSKFKRLDLIRSFMAIISILLLTSGIIKFHKEYYSLQ